MKKKSALRGHVSFILVGLVVVGAAAGVTGLALRGGDDSDLSRSDFFAVKRGDFDISIPVSGELAALRQIEIRNQVDGRAVITEIVPEGTSVKAGEVLLRLNDDEISTELRDAQDELNVAEAALIAAEAEYEIKVKTREAELAKADLAIMLADLALKAWQEGESVSKRQELALALETAQKEYDRLDARFKESAGLLEKKFISLDEYKQDEIAMIKARSELETSKRSLDVYEKYEFEQERAQKVSDLDQARSERERVEQQYNAEVRSAQSEVESKTFQLESAKAELAEEKQQLEYCTVVAPTDGLVVYYSSTQMGGGGRNEGRPPVVGTELTRNEPVIILPDISQMIASVKVSEALSGFIKPGQRANITSDAIPDHPLTGEVLSIGVMAESGGWRDPNRRDYTVKIKLSDGAELGLKPSMRCKAEVYVGRVSDALHMPVQAVLRNGSLTFVYSPKGSGFAQKQVTLGRTSELFTEVLAGLNEGDIVLLREPDTNEIVSRLPAPKNEKPAEADSEADVPEAPMPENAPPRGGAGRGAMGNGQDERPAGDGARDRSGGSAGEGERRGPGQGESGGDDRGGENRPRGDRPRGEERQRGGDGGPTRGANSAHVDA